MKGTYEGMALKDRANHADASSGLPVGVRYITVTQVATRTGVSRSTVIRDLKTSVDTQLYKLEGGRYMVSSDAVSLIRALHKGAGKTAPTCRKLHVTRPARATRILEVLGIGASHVREANRALKSTGYTNGK